MTAGKGVALRVPSAARSVENQDCTAWVMPTREIRYFECEAEAAGYRFTFRPGFLVKRRVVEMGSNSRRFAVAQLVIRVIELGTEVVCNGILVPTTEQLANGMSLTLR
jgi:hypothetical protein